MYGGPFPFSVMVRIQSVLVRGSCAERAPVAALAGSMQSVLQGAVPAFDGLRSHITKRTDVSVCNPSVVSAGGAQILV